MSHSFPGDPNFEGLLDERLWLGGSPETPGQPTGSGPCQGTAQQPLAERTEAGKPNASSWAEAAILAFLDLETRLVERGLGGFICRTSRREKGRQGHIKERKRKKTRIRPNETKGKGGMREWRAIRTLLQDAKKKK